MSFYQIIILNFIYFCEYFIRDLFHSKYKSELFYLTSFIHKKSLKMSKISHPCKKCGKNYSTAGNLRIHIENIHEGLRRFECDFCPKRFAVKDAYVKHVKLIHEYMKEFKCLICNEKEFKTRWALVQHVSITHDSNVRFQCEKCLKMFTTKGGLIRHYRNIHHIKM